MVIWVVFALMTGAAVLAVLWPLSRHPVRERDLDLETQFYREQLAEIDRDIGRGVLSGGEAVGAKAEAGRRLLRATAGLPSSSDAVGEPALRRRRAASAMALSVVPLLALAVYGAYGSPHVPAQPLQARMKGNPEHVDVAAAVARIEAHLAQHPEDGRGWEVVAPVYLRTGRFDDAAKAYETALRLLGESPPRLASYGEALVGAKDGMVPAEARAVFDRVLLLDPGNSRVKFYLAQAAEQDGSLDKARELYGDIIAHSPGDAPYVPLIREKLAALPGGSAAESIASLAPTDRQAAIRGMVEGLAGRLEASGGTADEWSRLIRSYVALGESEKAKSALQKARGVLAQNAPELASLEGLARELKVAVDPGRDP